MIVQIFFNLSRQKGFSIFVTFAGPDNQSVTPEIDIFDSQIQTLLEPQSAPVYNPCHQQVDSIHVLKQACDFRLCQHRRQFSLVTIFLDNR